MMPWLARPDVPDPERTFYEVALSELERAGLIDARRVRGLGDEIAILRLTLRRTLEAEPVDLKLLHAGVRLLIQALLAQHRLSPEQADELTGSVARILEIFGSYMSGGVDA